MEEEKILTGDQQVPAAEEQTSNQVEANNAPVQEERHDVNYNALRDEISRIKEENVELRQNMELVRSNVLNNQPQQAKPNEFGELSDEDIPTVKDIKNAWGQYEQTYRTKIEEMEVVQHNPDYAQVISNNLPKLIQEEPYLKEVIERAPNKALAAYKLAKRFAINQEAQSQQVEKTAVQKETERVIENNNKPGLLSQTGSTSAFSTADMVSSMSDEDFMKYASKNLDGI